ncbi:MAG: cytochrome c oxidase subunit 3 family protein [Prolixibacteraceae bacterium]|nr:cytochrome c oxidase subunit 3 family protein [Prolixibacteraceae bacterium]
MTDIHLHRDDEASKIGMWLFIFTELLLFGGLFIAYSIYRFKNPVAFHMAAEELDLSVGLINTIILLTSSATLAMAYTAVQLGKIGTSKILTSATIILAIVFLINKYFEWGAKFEHNLYPGSDYLMELSQGEILFFGLYFAMTGLHALHIIIGLILMFVVLSRLQNKTMTSDNNQLLENSGLYWHLVDIIWIFLFPLFYLIT